jgi:acetylornithine deacetylase/succinyl-diaminopimelate desuccinylase-like protein
VADRDAVAEAVLDAIDHDRAIELVRHVCRIPSVLGQEGPLAESLADTMRESGFEDVALQPVLPERPNAIGELRFGTGRRVVLTGHLDTKPVSHGWTRADPFSGDLIDGAVYGHGIMDMKAALACQLVALEAVRAADIPLAGTAAFAAVSDHMGDQRGSIAYFDAHPADLCVLGELSDNEIFIGHRGRYYFDITTLGRSAHTCHKPLAINANALAAEVVLAFERSALCPPLDPGTAALFGQETYMVAGRIYGGLPPGGPSMIPDECVVRIDARPQPGVTVETVRAEVDRCLAEARHHDARLQAQVELVDVKSPYLVDPEAEVVQLMMDAVRRVKREEPQLQAAGWLGDTSSFGPRVPTVVFGPGGEPVYCPDEHLSLEDIAVATQVYALFAAFALAPS